MKHMKQLLSLLIICLLLVLSLAACGNADTPQADGQDTSSYTEQIPEQSDTAGPERSAPEDETASDNTPGDIAEDDGLISEEEAIAIVLSRVDGAAASDIVSFQKEYDDGIWQYEGSLIYNGLEYEFEIDARNGTLLDWEIDN